MSIREWREIDILPLIKTYTRVGKEVKREMATAESCVLLEGGSLSAAVRFPILIETMPFKCAVL